MTLFNYEIIKTKHILFWRNHLILNCNISAMLVAIIKLKETGNIIIRYTLNKLSNYGFTGGYLMMIKYINK